MANSVLGDGMAANADLALNTDVGVATSDGGHHGGLACKSRSGTTALVDREEVEGRGASGRARAGGAKQGQGLADTSGAGDVVEKLHLCFPAIVAGCEHIEIAPL